MRNQRSLTRSPSSRTQAGMSLIEIIIVIVLIGAVLTFVGSRVLGGADRAQANLAKSQVMTRGRRSTRSRWTPADCPPSWTNW